MELSIVIPCYKEASDIEKNINRIKEYLKENKIDAEIIAVSDGSPDNTFDIIKNIPDIKGIGYEKNKGKGGATRFGLEHAEGDYIIFMDADLSTDLSAIIPCLNLLKEGNDFVAGSRYDKESNIKIKQPFKRRFISKCSRIIISSMFHFKLKDTQCGFKGMNKDTAKLLIEKSKMDGFSFDVEYLYIVKLNKRKYISLPVIWSDDRTSTVSPLRSSIRFFKDLFKIKKHKKEYLA